MKTVSGLSRGVSKTQTSKTWTPDSKNSDLGRLENSDPKNSDPLGVLKTQTWKIKHIYTAWMPQVDLLTVRRYIRWYIHSETEVNQSPHLQLPSWKNKAT